MNMVCLVLAFVACFKILLIIYGQVHGVEELTS